MTLSILIVRIIAVIYLAGAVGILSSGINYKKVYESFVDSPGLMYVTGVLVLIFGMLLVHYHNFWIKDWTVLVTIVAWLILIKGVLLIAFPQIIPAFKSWFKNSRWLGFLMLFLGIVFGYFGFILYTPSPL